MSAKSDRSGGTGSSKPPPASGRTPGKSPPRKGGKIPTRKDNVKLFPGSQKPTLTCYGFHAELPIEAYLYCKDDSSDGYLNGYKKFADGKDDSDELAAANFTSYKSRRVPGSANAVMTNGTTTYWRVVLLRYVPDGVSTKETRAHGLAVLSAYLKTKKNSDWPPTDIITVDNTNEENPHSLDMFFMDNDIVEIVQREFAEEYLNQEFYSTYNSFALKLWSGTNYPEFARKLGFP